MRGVKTLRMILVDNLMKLLGQLITKIHQEHQLAIAGHPGCSDRIDCICSDYTFLTSD